MQPLEYTVRNVREKYAGNIAGVGTWSFVSEQFGSVLQGHRFGCHLWVGRDWFREKLVFDGRDGQPYVGDVDPAPTRPDLVRSGPGMARLGTGPDRTCGPVRLGPVLSAFLLLWAELRAIQEVIASYQKHNCGELADCKFERFHCIRRVSSFLERIRPERGTLHLS